MELLIELIGEFILYGTAEVFTASIARNCAKSKITPERSKVSSTSAAVIYAVIGYFGGLSSLLIFPNHLITNPNFRFVSIIIIPVLLGFVMCQVGISLKNRCKDVVRLDSFPYGFLFALTFGIARALFAK